MPYNNDYNRSISRDIDYFNKRYIAHCDSTGTGTQNYRVQMATGLSGGGAGCAPCNFDSSDDESVGEGGAILGLQAGTILGGPRTPSIPDRKEISSFSKLGAPISKNATEEKNKNDVPNVTPDAPPPPPDAGAPPPKAGGAILGLTPYAFPAPAMTKNKMSILSKAVQPPIGRMYRAGKFVSVRDLGDDDEGPYNHQYKKSRYESDSDSDSSSESESDDESESNYEGGYCGDLPTKISEVPTRDIGAGKPPVGDTAKGKFNLERFADVGLKAMDKYDEEDDKEEDSEDEEAYERKQKKIGGYLDLAKKCHEMLEKNKGRLEGSGMLSVAAKGARLAARFGMKAAKAAAKAAAKGAKAAAKTAARGAKAAAKATARTAKAAAKGVAKGAKAAARVAKRGARAVKQAATKASKATKGRFGDVAGELASQGISALAKMASKGDEAGDYDYEEEEESEVEDEDEEDEDEEEEEEEGDDDKDADRADAEEEEEGEDEDEDDGGDDGGDDGDDAPKGMDQKQMMKTLEGKLSGNKDQKGPKWLKDAKETQQTQKEPIDNILGFEIFSKTPEADFVALFGDQYGNVEGKAITEIISGLQADGLKKEDIQKLLSQSQGALKTMAAKDVSETLKQQYDARQDFGNKNKNTSCMDAFNNVASKSETVQKETRPTRKNDTYFGTGAGKPELSDVSQKNMANIQKSVKQKGKESQAVQEGLKFAKAISKNKQGIIDQIRKEKGLPPQLPAMKGGFFKETVKATRGVQKEMVPKSEMVASTMSGMGKPKKGKKVKSEMQGSDMSGMGKPKKPNPRAEIVKKVMAEKGLSMIEASKYVKANNLYKK
jgi:hypothetical protein